MVAENKIIVSNSFIRNLFSTKSNDLMPDLFTYFRIILHSTAAPVLGKLSSNYAAGLTLHAGKSTIVEIPFSGAPPPSATWKWNGGQLPDPTRTKAHTMHDSTSLTLNRVERSDAGTYSLLLENSSGKANFAVKLKVIGTINRFLYSSLFARGGSIACSENEMKKTMKKKRKKNT